VASLWIACFGEKSRFTASPSHLALGIGANTACSPSSRVLLNPLPFASRRTRRPFTPSPPTFEEGAPSLIEFPRLAKREPLLRFCVLPTPTTTT